jgi:hypothetical protein
MHKEGSISIWFFIGSLLVIYGVLILATGIYELSSPPDTAVVLSEYHASIWWGALMLVLGLVWVISYRPGRGARS